LKKTNANHERILAEKTCKKELVFNQKQPAKIPVLFITS
jgi:hypothetical protein